MEIARKLSESIEKTKWKKESVIKFKKKWLRKLINKWTYSYLNPNVNKSKK